VLYIHFSGVRSFLVIPTDALSDPTTERQKRALVDLRDAEERPPFFQAINQPPASSRIFERTGPLGPGVTQKKKGPPPIAVYGPAISGSVFLNDETYIYIYPKPTTLHTPCSSPVTAPLTVHMQTQTKPLMKGVWAVFHRVVSELSRSRGGCAWAADTRIPVFMSASAKFSITTHEPGRYAGTQTTCEQHVRPMFSACSAVGWG
jgi:hypothetical protein